MRFTAFIAAGLFAVAASAQSSTSAGTAVASSTASVDPAQSSLAAQIQACLDDCDESDTRCRANCIAVPSPDTQNVNATTSCVAACPQGNGSKADNDAYADCVQGCIGQYYYTSTGTPNLATKAGGNSASEATGEVKTTITSGGSTFVTEVPKTASQASDAPASTMTNSDNGAAVYGPIGTGITFFGLLAGILAL
ncbi:hypothetical protein F5B22DRAFT_649900 [Xylaria bambusicola]|uniref:uncharacterized protein n=1 Tax=Xylaria bambusicola TaxID=326684 RepID=UPI0020087624|nr:uncharacterized protein F5B22DRAFT_649900 [Xylaria bambusicola]KAI0508604.1 hypothetical protein F5B22DRAFT_649900 [Xylaria bambusicola]